MNIRLIGRGILPPLLGAVRYALTLALFCVVWWYDARYLNWAFDFNLAMIKRATGLADGTGKAEALLRAFAAEKRLLFGEGSGLIWGLGRAATLAGRWLFDRGGRTPRETLRARSKVFSPFSYRRPSKQ